MIKKNLAIAALLALGVSVMHATQPANGSLALTGEVDGSLSLLFWQDPAGYQFVDGISNITVGIGDISAYGTPDGLMANKFTKTMDSDGFHVTTPFQLQVVQANLSSDNYRLMANLGDDDDTVWEVDGVTLSTTPALLGAAEPYTTKRPHILYAKFPFSKTATSLTDTITFVATAN